MAHLAFGGVAPDREGPADMIIQPSDTRTGTTGTGFGAGVLGVKRLRLGSLCGGHHSHLDLFAFIRYVRRINE